MIELPEAKVLANQASKLLKGLTIVAAKALHTPHKLCWMNQTSQELTAQLINKKIDDVTSSAHYLRFMFTDGSELFAAEDFTVEYKDMAHQGDKHQLLLRFDNGYILEFKVKMYAFLGYGYCDAMAKQWPYYRVAVTAVDPLTQAFTYEHFLSASKLNQDTGSIKQALATDQHIPGLGNGVLQDILYHARISPRRKVNTLNEQEKRTIYDSLISTLKQMVTQQGRDNSTLLDGNPGGYHPHMNSKAPSCPSCGGSLIKEAYLGGKVIYCPSCQK